MRDEVSAVAGVESVTVDLATKDVVVSGTGLVTADLVAAIDEAGYDGRPCSLVAGGGLPELELAALVVAAHGVRARSRTSSR